MRLPLMIWTICFFLTCVCQASPLDDYSHGGTALEINWRPNLELRHTPVPNTPTASEYGITRGLGDKTAFMFRRTNYDSYSNGRDTTRNSEFNILYRYSDTLRFFAGYSATSVREEPTSLQFHKNTLQFGLIGMMPLNAKSILYAVAAGGNHLVNIEAGWSYLLSPGLELNATYRHLSLENISSSVDKAHLRGFGLGLTYKF